MLSAKDYGFNEGYLLDAGADAPGGHTVIGSVGDSPLVIPDQILQDEYVNYSAAVQSPIIGKDPQEFGKAFGQARAILKATGIGKIPDPTTIQVGSDFRGDPVYSSAQLANNKDATAGKTMAETSGLALGAMGAFADFDEATKFLEISNRAQSGDVHTLLDKAKANGDPKSFIEGLGGDKSLIEYTGYKLFENWNNFSPAQKSIAIAGAGVQGYKFNDGQTFREKKLTPEIPGVPSMNAAEGLVLAGRGVNVAPATRKWNQLSAIQETFYTPKSATGIVENMNSLGLLGYGMDGRAVPIDETQMAKQGMQPEPHFGIGAATIPANQGAPTGYTILGQYNGRSIVIPTSNKGSAVLNAPDVASESASRIYQTWKSDGPVKQDRGVQGGSALAAGLDGMQSTNPYSLGAVVTYSSLHNTPPPKEYGDLEHFSYITGVSLQRLVNGNTKVDGKGKELVQTGEFTEGNFLSGMKKMRAEYAKQGVSSKEIGYQLANQGYAEGRFDESQTVALHRSLDMVFNSDGYNLAQKLRTGKNKGLEILERRHG